MNRDGEAAKSPSRTAEEVPDPSDCSIVIPTFNRPRYLARLLQYYDATGASLPVIVADSSPDDVKRINEESIAACRNLDVVHRALYAPSLNPFNKIIDAVASVATRFVVCCADDDFLIPPGMQAATAFLSSHPGYHAAQGAFVGFRHAEGAAGEIEFIRGSMYPASPIDDARAEARLLRHMGAYTPTIYAVHETPFIRQIHAYTVESGVIPASGRDPFLYSELYPSMLTVIYSRFGSLPLLYGARDMNSVSQYEYGSELDVAQKTALSSERYVLFRSSLAAHLGAVAGIDREEALFVVDRAMEKYRAAQLVRARRTGILARSTRAARSVFLQNRTGNRLRQWYRERWYLDSPPSDSWESREYSRIREAILRNSG
ncbi:MAG: TIGR00180 family glycosyltransferase [Methanomicrobiales archaeon]|nr:TIGR00180 family glycosyltransferase [Methanomicrobiales archaeon]